MDNNNFKDKVLNLYKQQNYKECVKECRRYIIQKKQAKKDKDKDEELWFYYFRLAMCYRQLKQLKKSICLSKIAMKYTDIISKQVQVNWLIGMCYSKFNLQKAVEYYDKSIIDCCTYGLAEFLGCIMMNKGELLQDENILNASIHILQQEYDKQVIMLKDLQYNKTYNFSLIDNIDEGYRILSKIYLSKKKYALAYKTLNKIKNADLKNKLRYEMQQIISIKVAFCK